MHRLITLLLAATLGAATHARRPHGVGGRQPDQRVQGLGAAVRGGQPGQQGAVSTSAPPAPLLQQIAKGAPVDVFVSADQETMDQAQSTGLVQAAQRRNFVSNTLVVIVPSTAAQRAQGGG